MSKFLATAGYVCASLCSIIRIVSDSFGVEPEKITASRRRRVRTKIQPPEISSGMEKSRVLYGFVFVSSVTPPRWEKLAERIPTYDVCVVVCSFQGFNRARK